VDSGWQRLRIGDLVSQVKRRIRVEPGQEYPLLGVRWYGKGAFLREVVSSETTKAAFFYAVQPGDFIYNRLFAWKGSFGLIPPDLSGCYVSGEFPLFEVDPTRLDRIYLKLMMCEPSVWHQIEMESTGSTKASRNRWKEERFLGKIIDLPPVEEQRRIVDVVGAMDDQVAALEAQAAATRTVRAGVLSELLSGERLLDESYDRALGL